MYQVAEVPLYTTSINKLTGHRLHIAINVTPMYIKVAHMATIAMASAE